VSVPTDVRLHGGRTESSVGEYQLAVLGGVEEFQSRSTVLQVSASVSSLPFAVCSYAYDFRERGVYSIDDTCQIHTLTQPIDNHIR
jgi:hypothetical protein